MNKQLPESLKNNTVAVVAFVIAVLSGIGWWAQSSSLGDRLTELERRVVPLERTYEDLTENAIELSDTLDDILRAIRNQG